MSTNGNATIPFSRSINEIQFYSDYCFIFFSFSHPAGFRELSPNNYYMTPICHAGKGSHSKYFVYCMILDPLERDA